MEKTEPVLSAPNDQPNVPLTKNTDGLAEKNLVEKNKGILGLA